MGTKYIIEVEDKPFELLSEDGFTSEKLFRVKGFNSLVFDWNGLNMLTPYTEPDLEQVREEANKIGYEKGYRDGVNTIGDAEDKIRKEAYEQGQKDLRESCVPKDEEAYGIGYNEGFQCGLDLAWDAARKIVFESCDDGMSCVEFYNTFNGKSIKDVMRNFTASEVITKIKEWKDSKQKIKVGDEVEDGVANLVVLEINEDGTVEGFTDYGSVVHAIPRKKTGRYFPEVVALLKNMKGK